MFRVKKVKNYNELFNQNKKIINSLESSTDEGSSQKTNIGIQSNHKNPHNMVILNNKTLSALIPNIIPLTTKDNDFKKDVLIKEIIGNEDNISNNSDRFTNIYDSPDNNKPNLPFKIDEGNNNKKLIVHNNASLTGKNNKKKNYNYKREISLEEYFKGNMIKKYKRKNSLNINRLKVFGNDYYINSYNNTPKMNMKNRTKNLTLNKKDQQINISGYNYTISHTYQNSRLTKDVQPLQNRAFRQESCCRSRP